MKSTIFFLVAALSIGCRPEHAPVAKSTSAKADDVRPQATAVAQQGGGVCPSPAGGLRIGLDSVAGMPVRLPVAALRKLCASTQVDSVFHAGFASPALRFDFRGGTIWAIQNIPDTDTLVVGKPVQSWEAVGDSIRFPDGKLIPRRLGQIRAADSVGYMSIEYGDNTEGADVTLCRVPALTFFFDTLPAPADTSVRPFSGISVADTSSYKQVHLEQSPLVLDAARRWCPHVVKRGGR